jgi:hypothetical protein
MIVPPAEDVAVEADEKAWSVDRDVGDADSLAHGGPSGGIGSR